VSESRLHSLTILALAVVIFALSVGAASLGAHRDGLYVEPGRLQAGAAKG
jgi:hypothetical protein